MVYRYYLLLVATRNRYAKQFVESFEIDTGVGNYDNAEANRRAFAKAKELAKEYSSDRPDKDYLIVCQETERVGCPQSPAVTE